MYAASDAADVYTLTLLRHGESVGNAGGYHQGQNEFALTERGLEQARLLGKYWKSQGVSFDHMLSSPLKRARQTAEQIAAALRLQPEYDPVWMERDSGKLSGLLHAQAAHIAPRPLMMTPFTPVGQTGESQWDLYLRAGQALQAIMRRSPGRYLVVSHGGLLNMFILAALGLAPQANFQGPGFRFSNTGFATLTYTASEHRWRVLGINERPHWNETAHLPTASQEENRSRDKKNLQDVHVRAAKPEDLPALGEINRQGDVYHTQGMPLVFRVANDPAFYVDFMTSVLQDENSILLIAEDAQAGLLGFLHATRRETPDTLNLVPRRSVYIHMLVIAETARGQGVGQQLMAAAEEWARAQGINTVELSVWDFNQNAIGFYEHLGYETIICRMWKHLNDPTKGNS